MALSTRYGDSNGAFGLYDNVTTELISTVAPRGSVSYVTGLANTLVVTAELVPGVNAEVLFGPHGQRFDVNMLLDGNVTIAGVDVAGIEISGDGIVINVAGEEQWYPANDLSDLNQLLVDRGYSETSAEAFTASIEQMFEKISDIDDYIDQFLDDAGRLISAVGAILLPTGYNNDGMPTGHALYEIPWSVNGTGDQVGTADNNVYFIPYGYFTEEVLQLGGVLTIFDQDAGGISSDRLVLEEFTPDQVTFVRNGHDLVLLLEGGGSVVVNNYFVVANGGSESAIEEIVFADNTIYGPEDILDHLIGEVTIAGTVDDDSIVGTSGDDFIDAGNGDDVISSGKGDDIILAGDGDDTLIGERGNKTAYGGTGNDTLISLDSSTFFGEDGDDLLIGNLSKGGDNTFSGGAGADIFHFANASNREAHQIITDFEVGVDSLILGSTWLSNLDLASLPDDMSISENANGDLVIHFAGADASGEQIHTITLTGVSANTFFGTTASEGIDGTEGNDTIDMNYVDVDGQSVSDQPNVIYGYGGDDVIISGTGADLIYGGAGDDTIVLERGNKTIYGEDGNDTLNSRDGSVMDGGNGDDVLLAHLGKGGDNIMTGGEGADTFIFDFAVNKVADQIITDFEVGTDTLIIHGVEISTLDYTDLPVGFEVSENDSGDLVVAFAGDSSSGELLHSVTLEDVSQMDFYGV